MIIFAKGTQRGIWITRLPGGAEKKRKFAMVGRARTKEEEEEVVRARTKGNDEHRRVGFTLIKIGVALGAFTEGPHENTPFF